MSNVYKRNEWQEVHDPHDEGVTVNESDCLEHDD
jgi:hypothetical protein